MYISKAKWYYNKMLTVHSSDDNGDSYGYGIWFNKSIGDNSLSYFTGSDPGVSFISCYKLDKDILITIVSNFEDNVWRVMGQLKELVFYMYRE